MPPLPVASHTHNPRVEESPCHALRPTVFIRNFLTLHTSSDSFPFREGMFHIPRASFCNRPPRSLSSAATQNSWHPNPFGSSCRWWAHGKEVLSHLFGLSPAGPHGQRSCHQALAVVPCPQTWLQEGAPVTHVWTKEKIRGLLGHTLSGPFPRTCLPWETLPEPLCPDNRAPGISVHSQKLTLPSKTPALEKEDYTNTHTHTHFLVFSYSWLNSIFWLFSSTDIKAGESSRARTSPWRITSARRRSPTGPRSGGGW